MHASGSFDVKLTPQTDQAPARMLLDKHFHGDLQGTSKGQMLAAMTEVKDSAGYVAIEQVTGSMGRRSGSFALQHFGVMNRGRQELIVRVVPDSGTGDLLGLSGTMTIDTSGGKHDYEFEYTLGN